MNFIRCQNGHYYDGDKYSSCPECSKGANANNQTMKIDRSNTQNSHYDSTQKLQVQPNSMERTVPISPYKTLGNTKTDNYNSLSNERINPVRNDSINVNRATAEYTIKKDPVVGWLVCINGDNVGEDFRIVAGRNYIGRANTMDICISNDKSISREKHAIITYEPKNNTYIAQPGTSHELFYVNDDVVLVPVKISNNDLLEIGNSKLLFIPLCNDKFSWDKRDEL